MIGSSGDLSGKNSGEADHPIARSRDHPIVENTKSVDYAVFSV